MTLISTIKCNKKIESLLQPVKVWGHSLVTAAVSNTSSGVDDATQ
jgi:hypothetical protein